MNNGRVTVWIGEREALPVRAIPYVTSWQESPNSIVRALTEPSTIKVGTNLAIPNRYLLVAHRRFASFAPRPCGPYPFQYPMGASNLCGS